MTTYVEYIDHDATVVSVDATRGRITLKVAGDDDCGACPAARLCSLSKADGKQRDTFVVDTPDAARYHAGERVALRGSERMHRRAILIATVIPCVLLIVIMTIIYIFSGGNQPMAALGGIVSMLFFFALLYLLRNKIRHEFHFTIHPIDSEKHQLP